MNIPNRDAILEDLIKSLDISPADFELAKNRYQAVAKWLEGGVFLSGKNKEIYLQGSFKLGTVIKPYRNGKDDDYDIDQVCEISGRETTAYNLKHDIGNRLKLNTDYKRMLDEEGRRCWTLEYASSDKSPGFHLDILPARPQNNSSQKIQITDKIETSYKWDSSNPQGYYHWFKKINSISEELFDSQRSSIFEMNKTLYSTVEKVPKQLVRTQLQRSIQLMKRHRDVYFNNRKDSPVSIIITTLTAYQFNGKNIVHTIIDFTNYVIQRHAIVTQGQSLQADEILDCINGKWTIKNPADRNENFADKWEQKPELATAFFTWIYQLKRDLNAFLESSNIRDLYLSAIENQVSIKSYGELLLDNFAKGPIGSSDSFLSLIHLGIEGKVPWDKIKEVAKRNIDYETIEVSIDIAWINFYQILIHSGSELTTNFKNHIKTILIKHSEDPAFIFCCNLLLRTADRKMLQNCLRDRGESVLNWPIVKLQFE
ncbi:MAG: nucleotidyltransferase [Melioribacteraceae bacterium]|jgi:hypothetical protein|nr:nucleotidyltransferase [Melioribacteraceae bacterium]